MKKETKDERRRRLQRERKAENEKRKSAATQAQVRGSRRDFNSTDTRTSSQKQNGQQQMKKKETQDDIERRQAAALLVCQEKIAKGELLPADQRNQLSEEGRRMLSRLAQASGKFSINGITNEALAKRPAPKPSTNAQQYTK